MHIISCEEFHQICRRSDVTLLKETYNQPKLLETHTGEIIKIFYPRNKRFSSNKFKPYALRFCENSQRLTAMGFSTPIVTSLQHCPEYQIFLISYQKLPGIDLRALAGSKINSISLVAEFLSTLHTQGVFFRAIHLENLLYQDNHTFALLDIVDVKFKKKPLSLYLRYRNLKHLFLNREDRKLWQTFGIVPFLETYFKTAALPSIGKALLIKSLKNLIS